MVSTMPKRKTGIRLDGPEELEDGEDDVVDVAEAGRLTLLGVVESASPVDADVGLPSRKPPRCACENES